MWFSILIAILAAYLLGNLNGSVLVSSIFVHEDVRRHGSGNAGLTNFIRNYGGISAVFVVLVDVGKAVAACLLGGFLLRRYGYYQEGVVLGALAVSLGHDFPALLGFRGGKGILCGITSVYLIDWRCGLASTAVFLITYLLTKYVSLSSILGSIAAGVYLALCYRSQPYVFFGSIVLALLAVYMHRANIRRLLNGTEPKTHLSHKGKGNLK